MSTLKSEIVERMNIIGSNVEVEGHLLRVSNAMTALQRDLDLLINSVINAQKGVLQPQVISRHLEGSVNKEYSGLSKGHNLTFSLKQGLSAFDT